MPEYRDVYTREGVKTGEIREKHAPNNPGDYFLHAIDILRCRDGRYILQQRSLKARFFPGEWDVTGGGVEAGETPKEAGIREAMEELGVTVRPEDMEEIHSFRIDSENGCGLIVSVFGCSVDLPEAGFRLAEMEVNDVKLVSFQEYYDTVVPGRNEIFGEALRAFEAKCQGK